MYINDIVKWKYPMDDEANDVFKIISITNSIATMRLYITCLDEMVYEPLETNIDNLKLH